MAVKYVPYEGPIVTREDAFAQGLGKYFDPKPCKYGHVSQRQTANTSCCFCHLSRRTARRQAARDAAKAAAPKCELPITVHHEGPIVSREDAVSAGVRSFFTGALCTKNHISRRSAANGACVQCALEYARRCRTNDPERVHARDATYRKKYYPDPKKAPWYQKQLANRREKYRLNPELRPKPSPEANRARSINYRSRKRAAGDRLTKTQIAKLLAMQRYKCIYCRANLKKTGYHADHKVPLSRGGMNSARNMQMLCPKCNLQKMTRDDVEYARVIGLLI